MLLFSCTSCTSTAPEENSASSAAAADEAAPGIAADAGDADAGDADAVEASQAAVPENAAPILDDLYDEDAAPDQVLAALENAGVETMDADSRLVYAVLLRSEGRYDESRDELVRLLDEEPGLADAWFNLALLEHAVGNADERDRALDEAIATGEASAEAQAFRGALAVAEERWPTAETAYRRALDLDGDSVESLMGMAWVMAKTDRTEEALPLLDRAVELEPEFVYARVDRSRVNVALGNYNDAEDDLDVAIEEEPDVPWHYLDRARIRLRHFKDYEGALSDLENVERLDPDNFFAMVYLAGLHDEERRFETASRYYDAVVELRPDYIWAYMPLGKYAWMRGDYDEAADWFLKAAAEDPDEFSFGLMAAMAEFRADRRREASILFAESLRQFERGETAYEVVRFCAERSSDFYAVNALNKESEEVLRERLWFYMGATYEAEGNVNSARSVYDRIGTRRGELEFDLAWAALNGMGG